MSNQVELIPEVYLSKLKKDSIKLLSNLTYLNNKDLEEQLINLIQKLAIAEHFYNHYIISIAGLQGVGKSTFLKYLYDIPDEYIPSDFGRGEKIPMLITEHNSLEYSCTIHKIDRKHNPIGIKQEKVKKEIFLERAKNPQVEDIFIQLFVPYNIFNTEEKSFVLLPGFENNDDDSYDKLIMHSIISSATCIMLFDETSYSQEDNSNLLSNLTVQFKHAKPLYILSKSDRSNDGHRQLRQKVMKDFSIKHEDRVITTGIYAKEPSKTQEWIEKVKNSLLKNFATPKLFREAQLKNLDCLALDLAGISDKVTNSAKSADYKNSDLEDVKHEIMQILEKETINVRDKYKKILSKELSTFAVKPNQKLEKYITEERTNLSKIFKAVGLVSVKARLKFRDKVVDFWNTENLPVTIKDIQKTVLNRLIHEKFIPLQSASLELNASKEIALYNLGEDKKLEEKIPPEIENDISILMYSKTKSADINSKNFKSLQKSVKLLPYIALEAARIVSNSSLMLELEKEGSSSKDFNTIVTDFGEDLKDFAASYSGILKVIGSFVGADVLVDGKFDGIAGSSAQIATALGISGKKAMVIAGALGALVVSSYAVVKLGQKINKTDFEDLGKGQDLISHMLENTKIDFLDKFDDLMSLLYNVVDESLNNRYNLDYTFTKNENLLKSISDLKISCTDLREALNANRSFLG